jgi:serine O-acetyltransferase
MSYQLKTRAGSCTVVARFIARQLDHLYPAGDGNSDLEALDALVPAALTRIAPILNAVQAYDRSVFDHLHTMQYATFLYLLANESWQTHDRNALAERLFCLNRALHALDLYYSTTMPEVFVIAHGLGTVLANVKYGERFVAFQQVTVGRVGEERPTIGANVVLYPGAVVTGDSSIGDNSVVSAGTVVHGVQVPPNVVVRMRDGHLEMTPHRRDYSALYFR